MDEWIEERREKRRVRESRLDQQPIVTVDGVVGANAVSGGKMQGDELWDATFSLVAWRIDDGVIESGQMVVHKFCSDADLHALQDLVDKESLVRFQAQIVDRSSSGILDARLQGFSTVKIDDEKLEELRSARLAPLVYDDPVLGDLTLNRSINSYEAPVAWLGNEVELSISALNEEIDKRSLQIAHELVEKQSIWHARAIDLAADSLLELKNDSWLEDDEDEVTHDEFIKAMTLESISVFSDKTFAFYFEDGDLFWGHTIEVTGSIDKGPDSANIVG
ncbi:MAG: DUF2262 domain-containing protein [Planctomycetota bacterium]